MCIRDSLNRVLVAAVAHADAPGELGEFARLVIELDLSLIHI